MRVTIIIEPGDENITWANLLDCDRIVENNMKYIIENYDNLPDIMIFSVNDVFAHTDEDSYFDVNVICRTKELHTTRLSKDGKIFATRKEIIRKEPVEWYKESSRDDLCDKIAKQSALL